MKNLITQRTDAVPYDFRRNLSQSYFSHLSCVHPTHLWVSVVSPSSSTYKAHRKVLRRKLKALCISTWFLNHLSLHKKEIRLWELLFVNYTYLMEYLM